MQRPGAVEMLTSPSGEQAPPAASPLLEIANVMVHLYKDAFGRGPSKARAQFSGSDTLGLARSDGGRWPQDVQRGVEVGCVHRGDGAAPERVEAAAPQRVHRPAEVGERDQRPGVVPRVAPL